MSLSLDVHSYDGLLKYEKRFSEEERVAACEKLKSWLTSDNARIMLNRIVNNSGQNFDACNNIDVRDLIVELTSRKIDDSLKNLIDEQLSDTLTSGECPQGRVTRIYQFL